MSFNIATVPDQLKLCNVMLLVSSCSASPCTALWRTCLRDGKSALFAVPMIVLLEVAGNPTAYPGFTKYKKPVALVIAPTKGLAANIVFELAVLRVPALAYTSDVLADARKAGRNITSEIMSCRWPIVCIDPEHLMDKQWERITDCQLFRDNIAFVSADEAHLIDEWGEDFRPAFRHIGNFIRGRLPPNVAVSALTATLGSNAAAGPYELFAILLSFVHRVCQISGPGGTRFLKAL
ncbi:ATP-dependent DNA helicase RecQ [Mycena venus]|uniref:ATP-dependent DNA helicase RecQ n=1 Tax=Mycena venus TaxID=2733690 RepID=A0A8H6X1X1_9AGAR|nr:ATP-dependent DNA helicase RecQ [Mycena venus]